MQCWLVVHHAAAPVARAARHIARPLLHALHPHRVLAPHPRVWVELVCRLAPAATVAGGLLVPSTTGLPPRPPGPPLAEMASAAPVTPVLRAAGVGVGALTSPQPVQPIWTPRPPPPSPIPEPPAVWLLLGGLAALAAVRAGAVVPRRGGADGRRSDPAVPPGIDLPWGEGR
jgi:hypothetical protein